MKELSCDQLANIGQEVVNWFDLKESKIDNIKSYSPERYETNYGNKTLIGLGNVIISIVEANKDK